jgi:NADH-quinone oxidoreductase subunit J
LGKNYVPGNANIGTVENLGNLLFSKYVVPFEVSSILFIAAMVGAVLLAKREKQIID